jgi:predicted TIM-barrel fold metal-dependent hydrolase
MTAQPLVDSMLSVSTGRLRAPVDQSLERFGSMPGPETVHDVIAEMDRNDVELAVIGGDGVNFDVYRPGPYAIGLGFTDELFDASCSEIAANVAAYPDRLRGFIRLDPSDGMAAVQRLERAVRTHGIAIAHIIPSVVGLAPNHPTYFPIYAKCVELDVTLRVNIGMPGPSHRAKLQEPILLDEILLTFPDLTLIGAHLGHPWIDQVIALLRKYEHFYLMTSGWVPSRVPSAIWDFADTTRGAEKIMWASDYPLLPIGRTATEGRAVPLKPDNKQRYLHNNAIQVHNLRTSGRRSA